MPRMIHSVAVQNQIQGADGVFSHELSVNPLSVILINLRPLNETSTLTAFQSYLSVCDAINRIQLLHRGQSIISMTGRDAAMLAFMRHGIVPMQNNHTVTDNERRCVTLPILLGRNPYDVNSCFPESRSGELVLELDLDDASGGYDDLQYTVETIELLGATPKEFERKIQFGKTNQAVGIQDLDLPVGNQTRGILLFGSTPFTGATPAPSWGRVSTVVDGVELGYTATDFEVAHMLHALRGVQPPAFDGRGTLVDATAANANEPSHTGPFDIGSDGYSNYAFLDLDPTRDDMFSIDTSQISRFQVRATVETADAVRAIPIERIQV